MADLLLSRFAFCRRVSPKLASASRRDAATWGFISVGAVGQRSVNTILSLMVLALWFLRRTRIALNGVGGIVLSVLRRIGEATRRLDSSLRSHRTWRSYCRDVYSGLKKTLFAPVGPNSRCRGHQAANPAGPGSSLEENKRLLGRIN